MEYQLYCRAESGNAYKAAMMLNLCGLRWKPHFVDFFNDETRGEFRADVNELGELPVLKADGLTLSQSGVILTYLSEKSGKFGGKTEDERREVLRWLLYDNHRFTPNYATLRFMRGLKRMPDSPVTEWLRGQAIAALETVNERLKDRPFVVGSDLTIADISMSAYQFYQEETGIDRSPYSHINAWLERIASHPGWAPPYDLMPRAMIPTSIKVGAADETLQR